MHTQHISVFDTKLDILLNLSLGRMEHFFTKLRPNGKLNAMTENCMAKKMDSKSRNKSKTEIGYKHSLKKWKKPILFKLKKNSVV